MGIRTACILLGAIYGALFGATLAVNDHINRTGKEIGKTEEYLKAVKREYGIR